MDAEYKLLQESLIMHRRTLSDAADVIMDQQVSSYPLFVAFRQEVELGVPLIAPAISGEDWGIHASTLEELTARGVMQIEKVNAFREVYKDPRKFLCILVLRDPGAEFVFFPRLNVANQEEEE